jgi:hypothetical protein
MDCRDRRAPHEGWDQDYRIPDVSVMLPDRVPQDSRSEVSAMSSPDGLFVNPGPCSSVPPV